MLSFNKVHTIEAEALESLTELETLDLSQNAVTEVPAGLPKSLHKLYLNGNPVTNLQHLARAVGLEVLQLRSCDLNGYPELGLLPNLVDLDVSDNNRITDLTPIQLAGTCRLARLNLTETNLFRSDQPGSHCRCRRVVEWAETYKIRLIGLGPCPDPVEADSNGGDDDPNNENCARAPEAARVVFKECMAEWEHRNTPYWAIFMGLAIVVAVLLSLCVCLRRRSRRRHAEKVQSVPTTDCTKENNDSVAAGNKTEPAALLST